MRSCSDVHNYPRAGSGARDRPAARPVEYGAPCRRPAGRAAARGRQVPALRHRAWAGGLSRARRRARRSGAARRGARLPRRHAVCRGRGRVAHRLPAGRPAALRPGDRSAGRGRSGCLRAGGRLLWWRHDDHHAEDPQRRPRAALGARVAAIAVRPQNGRPRAEPPSSAGRPTDPKKVRECESWPPSDGTPRDPAPRRPRTARRSGAPRAGDDRGLDAVTGRPRGAGRRRRARRRPDRAPPRRRGAAPRRPGAGPADARRPRRPRLVTGDGSLLTTDGCPTDIYDLETGRKRPTTAADVVAITRIVDALDEIDWTTVSAQDRPVERHGPTRSTTCWPTPASTCRR